MMRLQGESRVEAATNGPAQAISIDYINQEIADRPNYTMFTLWISILDSFFLESVDIYQVKGHYIRTEGYIIGDGNCMFRELYYLLLMAIKKSIVN